MFKNLLLLTSIIVVLHGCSLAPRYEKPLAPISAEWPAGAAYDFSRIVAGAMEALDLAWRNFFQDERLHQVIALALDNNRDLRIAGLNVQKARAMYGIQRAELLPTVDAIAGGTKGRISSSAFGGDGGVNIEQYSVNFGISSWELDFFGRLRSLKDRALEEYLATEEARRSAQIALVFEIANAYLNLAADRENLNLAKTTFETQKHAYDLIQKRVQSGISNELDLQWAQIQVDSARVNISRYSQLTAQDENALHLLVGTSSPIPQELLPEDLGSVTPPQVISTGLPSEVLLNRPDILAAEHRLKAAHANVAAARVAFFPRIALTTALGTASGDLMDLFSKGTETWSFAPQLIMPIFDSRLWSAFEASKTEKEIMVVQYEKAIQTAFREVADTLAVQGTVDEQISAQQSLVDANARSYQLSETRYTGGVDSYLSVLDAQRSLYAAQQQLVTFRLIKFVNQARLYAVLGGGS
ncbi:MAG: efflux transporter outer membrane subunit [Candidatus Omnitrophota bacterium]|jgi:multidrug efflux system outer membrane protein|nr:MAG: efflux transporter outer membrane subunit [Candidatus Omnitrophota bacterium]